MLCSLYYFKLAMTSKGSCGCCASVPVNLAVNALQEWVNLKVLIELPVKSYPGGVLDFGLDGGVPPGPRDPNPCLKVKKVPMFRDFAQKIDSWLRNFLKIFWARKFL